MTQEDRIISEFLRSLGPWKDFIVIGGGFALFIYKLYLSDPKLVNFPVATRDIDSLIPRRVPHISQKDISKYLCEAGFIQIYKDLHEPPTESYKREIDGIEIEVEFLTDLATRADKTKNAKIEGIIAQPLSYLELSLQRTMTFQTHSQEIGKVVSPEAWIFHKGLTFTKRNSILKMLKDLYGIWYVALQLGEFSEKTFAGFSDIASQHRKWFQTFQSQLMDWMERASPSDWAKLEAQDPSGKLKKPSFERGIRRLIHEAGNGK